MIINLQTRLADIVSADERHAGVLDSAGLDYCCGGARTLGEAAGEAGLDASTLLGSLLAATGPSPVAPDWSRLAPSELCDHIVTTHHRYLRDQLPVLVDLAAKVESVHGERHPELADVRSLVDEIEAEVLPHLDREEADLFPAIAASGLVDVDLVAALEADHDDLGRHLDRLRSLTDGFEPPADGCASYRSLYRGLAELDRDTRLHVHKENNVLFDQMAT